MMSPDHRAQSGEAPGGPIASAQGGRNSAEPPAPAVRGWKATIAVSMSNYIEAGSIIALATSLTFWQEYFGFSNWIVGLVAALSANAFGAGIGALIGGPLGDRYGRKFIYTYDLILYMVGTLFVICAVQAWMLVLGVILTGIAVGAGVPVAWTYIAEQAPHEARSPCRHRAARLVARAGHRLRARHCARAAGPVRLPHHLRAPVRDRLDHLVGAPRTR